METRVALIGIIVENSESTAQLNALLHEERAIVSEIRGTTRDVIEDTTIIDGLTFRFIDTAGIRETSDKIESLGIERSFKKLAQAEIVLWVIDSTTAATEYATLSEKILPHCKDKQVIIVLNKADLSSAAEQSPLFPDDIKVISISAKQKQGIKELEDLLVKTANIPSISQNNIIVTNIRHYEALSKALESIHRVQEGLDIQLSGDFISQDLRECLFHLAEIVGGEITTDEVLGNIFKHFCVGK